VALRRCVPAALLLSIAKDLAVAQSARQESVARAAARLSPPIWEETRGLCVPASRPVCPGRGRKEPSKGLWLLGRGRSLRSLRERVFGPNPGAFGPNPGASADPSLLGKGEKRRSDRLVGGPGRANESRYRPPSMTAGFAEPGKIGPARVLDVGADYPFGHLQNDVLRAAFRTYRPATSETPSGPSYSPPKIHSCILTLP